MFVFKKAGSQEEEWEFVPYAEELGSGLVSFEKTT
jgi:hypothetical protein